MQDPHTWPSHLWALAAHKWLMENTSGPEPGWEKAHTPLPRGEGDEWVWLTHELHQIHGVLQTIDHGRRCCFGGGRTGKALAAMPFIDGWFDLWEGYDLGMKLRAEAIGRSRTGSKHSAETKAKISKSRTGQKLTAEHRAKISASAPAQKTSEHRAKIGEGNRKRGARKRLSKMAITDPLCPDFDY